MTRTHRTLLPLLACIALAAPAFAQTGRLTRDSRRDCAICHMQWMDAFEKFDANLLVDPPTEPVVARDETCLGCHDGSVDDSRRRVWLEHGHQTGIAPPAGMNVPDHLPLDNGKIACRTCHTAHGGGPETIATAVFLRVPNDESQLCQSCHTGHTKGPGLGTHPIGGMPWPVPDALIAAGAKAGSDRFRLICQTCHTPHGAPEEHLLVMGTESSQLCLTCHTQLRPGLWRPDVEREHPQNPPLESDAQRLAIQEMGTHVGANDTLICLSCHKLHHGLAGRNMLADTLEGSHLCLRCHPGRESMFGSMHDLRVNHPDERNRLGQTPATSGPCGACHSFHQFARRPDPQPLDPTGLCTTCHQQGQCAERVPGLPFSHPSQVDLARLPREPGLQLYHPPDDPSARRIACLTCHNPHEVDHAKFLREQPDQICAECHSDRALTLAGAHDFTQKPDVHNGRGLTAAETGKCGFCHGVHNAEGPSLWVATDTAPQTPDDYCLECHRADGLAAAKPESMFHHPTGPRTLAAAEQLTSTLPRFDATCKRNEAGFVACASCHDPHANSNTSPAMLNRGPSASALCTDCHVDPAHLAGGIHDINVHPDKWPAEARQRDDLCLSCHRAHSNDPEQKLWTVTLAKTTAEGDAACLACHSHLEWASAHGAAAPGTTIHPRTPATNEPHDLPLVTSGPGKTPDLIGCKTCHNPHGPMNGPAHLLRGDDPHDPAEMCMRCHSDVRHIGQSMHGAAFIAASRPADGMMSPNCSPCHAVHSEPGLPMIGPGSAADADAALPPGVADCLACHSNDDNANRVTYVAHPTLPMQNADPPGSPGFMPLVDDTGKPGETGRMACVTCHAPHGRPTGGGYEAVDPESITRAELQQMMPMLRPYVAPNLCSSCHGFEGLSRFLYYHRPALRKADADVEAGGTR